MNNDRNHARIYPMKKLGQSINQIMGVWAWLYVFAGILASLFLALIFPWNRKIIPAFRRMMKGIPGSYLRISESGLEYRIWPFTEIRCKWEDVKCIKKRRWFGDVLYLHRAEEFGFAEFSINLSPPQIHLSSLVGWQDGELENDLRHYAPRLFQES